MLRISRAGLAAFPGTMNKQKEMKNMKYRNVKERILHRSLCNLMLTLTFFSFGCQDQELVQSEESTDAIAFALYSHGEDDLSFSPLTRTLDKPLVLFNEDRTDSLTFYLTITDSIDLGQSIEKEETLATRGTLITNNNLTSCSGEISLDAFYQNTPFIKDVLLFDNNGNPHTQIKRYWPATEGAKVAFWSYHPKEIAEATDFNITHGDSPTLSFYYDLKDADNDKLVDVQKQKDLFFAYRNQGKEQGAVELRYQHALSAVKFVAGQTLAGTIENISMTHIVDGGKLTYTPTKTPSLTWQHGEGKSTLNQNFNVEIDENLKGDPTQTITSDAEGTTFLLIPQSIGESNTLSVTFKREGKNKSDTYSARMPEGTWKMGKTYTYTLKLMDGLDIEASAGAVGANAINGVEIKNTYDKPCYIRALIIANWVDSNGCVAAIFNPADVNLKIEQGNNNYQFDQDWDTYWLYDETMNIYYYKKPLTSGQTTAVKLFDKFTNPKNRTNEGLKLDFTVLVQAVEAEANKASVKAAWGENIANQL